MDGSDTMYIQSSTFSQSEAGVSVGAWASRRIVEQDRCFGRGMAKRACTQQSKLPVLSSLDPIGCTLHL